ncbi:MAG TPA: hypothetical protein V6C90_14755 [Coleofasciculaceae cyanobacterium]
MDKLKAAIEAEAKLTPENKAEVLEQVRLLLGLTLLDATNRLVDVSVLR